MNTFKFFFGTGRSSIFSIEEVRSLKYLAPHVLQKKVDALTLEQSSIKHVFLNQTHSNQGAHVHAPIPSFIHEGDFLITNKPNVALSILTADCLPLTLYDPTANSCAIVHAGWKGSVQKIAQKTIKEMQYHYATKPQDIVAQIGPCAKVCCYKVSDGFAQDFYDDALAQSLVQKNNALYFDNVLYTTHELIAAGVYERNIHADFNRCTMCNAEYGSFRRLQEQSPLNISYIYLY